jgi:hypothetical protein
MAALFLFAAALQFNDQDPLPWIAMYLAAATPCVFAALGRPRWRLAGGVAVLAALWACVYLFQGAWRVPPSAMFAEWTMSNAQVREARELYGLVLISGFMAFSAWTSKGSRKPV